MESPAHRDQRLQDQRLRQNIRRRMDRASVVNEGMTTVCGNCGALRFPSERPGICCNHGKVVLPYDPAGIPPEPLLSLFSGLTARSRDFLLKTRRYNNAFAMTSIGISEVNI